MPQRPPATRRWLTAATWPIGIGLTCWDYMWRTTPMRRNEASGSPPSRRPELLVFPAGVSRHEVLSYEDGVGPLFHRSYRTRIREGALSADELMEKVQRNPNSTAPTQFARFHQTLGRPGHTSASETSTWCGCRGRGTGRCASST